MSVKRLMAGGLLVAAMISGIRIMSDLSGAQAAPRDQTRGKLEKATFGAGCFWCTEAVFQQLKGVKTVVSGYSGGKLKNPTYEDVSTGNTGHAEVVQISFDPNLI